MSILAGDITKAPCNIKKTETLIPPAEVSQRGSNQNNPMAPRAQWAALLWITSKDSSLPDGSQIALQYSKDDRT